MLCMTSSDAENVTRERFPFPRKFTEANRKNEYLSTPTQSITHSICWVKHFFGLLSPLSRSIRLGGGVWKWLQPRSNIFGSSVCIKQSRQASSWTVRHRLTHRQLLMTSQWQHNVERQWFMRFLCPRCVIMTQRRLLSSTYWKTFPNHRIFLNKFLPASITNQNRFLSPVAHRTRTQASHNARLQGLRQMKVSSECHVEICEKYVR